MNETTTAPVRLPDVRVPAAARLDDLLAAVRMSWDELFELPEPRPLSHSAA
jgi:hypothetical protein